MVFVNKKARCDDISSDLNLRGTPCQSIHGGREQSDREQAIDDLKTGEVNILIATDVASRGIDIQESRMRHELTLAAMFGSFQIGCPHRKGEGGHRKLGVVREVA